LAAEPLIFGAERADVDCPDPRVLGAGASLFAIGMLAIGVLMAKQGVGYLWFFGLLGIAAGAYGVWMVQQGERTRQARR